MASRNRLSVNLSDAEFSALSALALNSKVSMAWLGRYAIGELLDRAANEDLQLPLAFPEMRRRA